MATALLGGAVCLPCSKPACLPSRTSSLVPVEKLAFNNLVFVSQQWRNDASATRIGRADFSVRARAAPTLEQVSKRLKDASVTLNYYPPENPFVATCRSNRKISGNYEEETHHIVLNTQGKFRYLEGQNLGVIPNGDILMQRLFSLASSARGDFGDFQTLSLCVRRVGIGSAADFLCDLKTGDEVQLTGPSTVEMLMPVDPNSNIIFFATETGIAPFRSYSWKIFFEDHPDYKFSGLAWLFFGAPTYSTLFYDKEFEKMKEKSPSQLRLDYAVSTEGEKQNIADLIGKYGEELWQKLLKDNTYVYVSGVKGMEIGIEEALTSLAAEHGVDWQQFKRVLQKEGRWKKQVYNLN